MPLGAAALRIRFERQLAGPANPRELWLNWTVRERASTAAIGTVQATVAPAEQLAALAWVIGVPHQGRGYATEAAGVVATWLRDHGVHNLHAHIHPDHGASIAVARAVGLEPTELVIDGELRWQTP